MIKKIVGFLNNKIEVLILLLMMFYLWSLGSLEGMKVGVHLMIATNFFTGFYFLFRGNRAKKISCKQCCKVFLLYLFCMAVTYLVWRLFLYSNYAALLAIVYCFAFQLVALAIYVRKKSANKE